ncbi:tubulin epsilon and delta complex protein 1 isoform X3 [Lathamus discolor]|uniref:tubulin epsilon and delta complex protein 1 isoform X3 n=1 Tax=Lathamus discolor TaxID=678569 RepID=UPI0032B77D2E
MCPARRGRGRRGAMRRQEPEQEQRRGRPLPGAVGALCRALPPRARPAPDTLRRAKFDRPQASLDFWRLLYTLLKQIHGHKWAESDAIDNQIRFVKAALWYHGYDRPELYRLPSDGSAGSRELLLAFSWLLHRISLLEQILAQNRVKTGDETSVCTCEDDLRNSLKGTTEKAPEPGLEGGVDVRYLQWLNGRLRFQWRSLHAQHQEQCKLLHKIHLFTSGSHMDQILGHFSVTETDLVRQPENYKQLLQLLESETMQLEAFLEWKQLEPVYWQWMVKTREEELQKEGFSATARKIQESVELKLLDLAYLCAPPRKRMHGSHRLVFRSKHPASKMVFGGSVSKESVSIVSATEVIRKLQMRETSLARELKQLREESRQRLAEVAEGLDGVICISP